MAQPPHLSGPLTSGLTQPGDLTLKALRGFRSWQHGLPSLQNAHVTLREVKPTDAVDLFQAMTRAEVSRFISPPPSTINGFEQFAVWAQRERASGANVCLAILAPGSDTAVGLIQIRSLDGNFRVSEWGFAVATEYWGTGLFMHSAQLALHFAFTELGVHRLEARAAVKNGRGNGVLRKIGAVQEGVLRQAFFRSGEFMDQVLWSMLADDWLNHRRRPSATPFH